MLKELELFLRVNEDENVQRLSIQAMGIKVLLRNKYFSESFVETFEKTDWLLFVGILAAIHDSYIMLLSPDLSCFNEVHLATND